MKQRLIFIYIVAAVFAFGITLLTRKIMQFDNSQANTKVLIAAKDMAVGTIVAKEDLTWQLWPVKALNPSFIEDSNSKETDRIIGSIVRYTVIKNEPILSAKFVRSSEKSLLAAIISPGKRAFTLQMGKNANLTGLLSPGDIVDIVIATKNAQNLKDSIAETIVRKVPVIATDGRLARDETVKKIEPPEEVTIEITPQQAEYLAAALRESKPTITVYSLTSSLVSENEKVVDNKEITQKNNEPLKKESVQPIQPKPIIPLTPPVPPQISPDLNLPPKDHTISVMRGSEKLNVHIKENNKDSGDKNFTQGNGKNEKLH